MNNKNNNTTPYAGLLAGANPVMAVGSALLVLAFIVFTVADPEYADGIYTAAKKLYCYGSGLVLHRDNVVFPVFFCLAGVQPLR